MTKKDYEMIASAIKQATTIEGSDDYDAREDTRMTVAIYLANQLSWNNPTFDRARFLKACGLED